jgi:hypothetical protein
VNDRGVGWLVVTNREAILDPTGTSDAVRTVTLAQRVRNLAGLLDNAKSNAALVLQTMAAHCAPSTTWAPA